MHHLRLRIVHGEVADASRSTSSPCDHRCSGHPIHRPGQHSKNAPEAASNARATPTGYHRASRPAAGSTAPLPSLSRTSTSARSEANRLPVSMLLTVNQARRQLDLLSASHRGTWRLVSSRAALQSWQPILLLIREWWRTDPPPPATTPASTGAGP